MTNSPDQVNRDVVVIGGCGHVGLPLALAFADRGARVVLYDVSEAAVATVNVGPAAVRRAGRRRGAAAGCSAPAGCAASTDPAVVGQAEHVVVVIGTPSTSTSTPTRSAVPTRARARCATTSATASCSSCAAPCTRASPRWSSGCSPSRGLRRRRRVLPRADRRGQGDDRAVRAAADRLRPRTERAAERAERALRHADRPDRASSSPRRPSSPSCSPTPGATSSSPPPTSSS